MLSNVQNELQITKTEKENLERELQQQRRLSSGGGSSHLSVDISGPPIEPVPSANVQVWYNQALPMYYSDITYVFEAVRFGGTFDMPKA